VWLIKYQRIGADMAKGGVCHRTVLDQQKS
jgi:hypothetical protein